MFNIKRKLIIAILLSLTVLSGCARNETEPVHIFSDEGSSASQTQSTATSSSTTLTNSTVSSTSASSTASVSSAPVSSTGSSSEKSTESISVPEPHVSSSSEYSEPTVSEPAYSKTVVYNNDPKNYCTVTFSGDSITITGKYGDLFEGAAGVYPKMNVTRSENNGILTCVLTPKSTRYDESIGSFIILDKGKNNNTVFIDLSKGSLMCPDTSALVKNNSGVLNNITAASEYKIAQYITLDGSRDKIPEILGEVQRLSDEICAGANSDYEKLRAISRWVSDNIFYDHPIYNLGAPQYCLSLEYTLTNRAGICGSYSNLTSALCAAQGIRCLNITGMAAIGGRCFLQTTSGAYHEWNIAEIDGRTVIVDSGWNSGNGINNDGSLKVREPIYKYFDISEEVFSLDHIALTAEYRDYFSLLE